MNHLDLAAFFRLVLSYIYITEDRHSQKVGIQVNMSLSEQSTSTTVSLSDLALLKGLVCTLEDRMQL